MNNKNINKRLTIIAGPCAIDLDNINIIYEIAKIEVINSFGIKQRATFGTRIVGLKSRSKIYEGDNNYMGLDYEVYLENLELLASKAHVDNLKMLPSIEIAKRIVEETGLLIATELMSPMVQLPLYERLISKDKLFLWNPAINQLGWSVLEISQYAIKNGWYIGLKNGKWLCADSEGVSTMEKNWIGNASFAKSHLPEMKDKVVLIHRGVEVKQKGNYRSLPVHDVAKRAKMETGVNLFFDPSHSLGWKLRDRIVDETIEVMKMKMLDGSYLYDGLLIEVGTAQTDTEQHITVSEYKELVNKLSIFRDLTPPKQDRK